MLITLASLTATIWAGGAAAGFVPAWQALADERDIAAGDLIVRQLHPADAIWLLVDGTVRHTLVLPGSRVSVDVGGLSQPGFPLGWSGLVAPNRYATSAVALPACRLDRRGAADRRRTGMSRRAVGSADVSGS